MAFHIRLIAIGTRGDVQPYVALGLGLQAAGYDITVVTTRDFASFVTGAGLNVRVSPFDLQRTLASSQNRRHNRRARLALLDDMLAHLVPLCTGADLVLYSPVTSIVMPDVLEHLQIAGIPALLQPFIHPTAAFPPSVLPRLPFGRWSNRLSYALVDRLVWLSVRRKVSRWRQERLGLPPTTDGPIPTNPGIGHVRALRDKSPAVVPRPDDWPASVHLTGY